MITRNFIKQLALTAIACLVTTAPGASFAQDAAQAFDLRPLWKDGQRATYKITQQEFSSTTSPDNPNTLEERTDIELDLTWEVLSASPDGGGVASMTLDNLIMTLTGPDGIEHRVTPTEAEELLQSAQDWINALLGTPIQVSIGPTGHIEAVSNYEPIIDKAGDAGSDMDEAYFIELAREIASLTGGDADQAPGAIWSFDHNSSHRIGMFEGDLAYQTTAEFKGVEEIAGVEVALIDRTSTMEFTPDLSDIPPQAPPIHVQTNEASETSQIMVDLSRHEIVGAFFQQVLEVEMSITLPDREIRGVTREVMNTKMIRTSEE